MERPSAILVLGAAVWPGGVASPTLARRIAHASHLAAKHPDAFIIGCGGLGDHPPSEAEVIRDGLCAAGTNSLRVLLEDRSTSTIENIAFAQRLLQPHTVGHAILVTDGYHMPRALMIARALGLPAEGAPVPWPRERGWRAWLIAHGREALARPVNRWRLWRRQDTNP